MISLRRLTAISNKEFIHIIRDPRSLGMVVAIPLIMLLLYGYALTTDVKHIALGVMDGDKTRLSRDFIGRFSHSEYFDIKYYPAKFNDLKELFDGGAIKAALIIRDGFARRLRRGDAAKVQFLLDGSDNNAATVGAGYINNISQQFSRDISVAELQKRGFARPGKFIPIEIEPRIWYNPTLRSANFLVPGLIATIMMMMAVILTSLAMVGEREHGTLEQIVASPVRGIELILGKLLPYGLIALGDLLIITVVGIFWFGVPLKGSLVLLLGESTIFLLGALGLGLLISTVARTQQEAMMMSMLATLLPTFLLSGFVFPISSMPVVIQGITYLVPARYFLSIIRGIFMKGTDLGAFWMDTAALATFAVVIVTLALSRFKKKLD